MFFSISQNTITNFPIVRQFGSVYVGLDEGWHFAVYNCKDIVYKGYTDQGPLHLQLENIVNEKEPSHNGNFCVLVFDENIRIYSSKYRSFPLFYNDNEITNLCILEKSIGANVSCNFDYNLKPTFESYNLTGQINEQTLSIEQVIEKVDHILSEKIQKFIKHNPLPLKIFLTGGLDTMLLYSYIKKYTENFELLNYYHFEFDNFWLLNGQEVQKNWAYKQLHHWSTPCVLVVGTPGDEFMLRSPNLSNVFLRHYDTEIRDLLKASCFQNCIHYEYFNKQSNIEIFKKQEIDNRIFKNKQMLTQYLCHILYNDFQHWHLGHTLTYTPLRDLEIFKLFLQLDLESAKQQIMNGYITKELIRRNDSSLLECIAEQKNSKNSMSKLIKLF